MAGGVDQREKREVQAVTFFGVFCQTLDEIEQRATSPQVAVIEAGEKRQSPRFVRCMRPEKREARQISGAPPKMKRPQWRTEHVPVFLRERVEQTEVRLK